MTSLFDGTNKMWKIWINSLLTIILFVLSVNILAGCGSTESVSTTSSETKKIMSEEESYELIHSNADKITELSKDIMDALGYYQDHDFSDAEQFRVLEKKWDNIYEKTSKQYNKMKDSSISTKYFTQSLKIADEWEKVNKAAEILSNIDIEDPHKVNDFYAPMKDLQSTFVESGNKIISVIQYDLDKPNNTDDIMNSHSNLNVTCEKCNLQATKSFKNPFSGKTEYYCPQHYKVIKDSFDRMESDVGKSNYSKHLCMVSGCTNEGIYSMTGLNGTKEYYCTKHYKEMEEILKSIQ